MSHSSQQSLFATVSLLGNVASRPPPCDDFMGLNLNSVPGPCPTTLSEHCTRSPNSEVCGGHPLLSEFCDKYDVPEGTYHADPNTFDISSLDIEYESIPEQPPLTLSELQPID